MHFCGNSHRRNHIHSYLKGLHTCEIHTNITAVIRKILVVSITFVFGNFYIIISVIIISKFRGFASEMSETKIDNGFINARNKLFSVV